MKIVREHISEAFSETGDPIKDMGLGVNFSNLTEAANFIVHILPEITREENLEKYLNLEEGGAYIASYLWGPIWDYAVEHIKIDGMDMRKWSLKHSNFDDNLPSKIRDAIISEIIKRKSRANEAFSETGDPIHDMGIGYKTYVQKKLGLEYDKALPETFFDKEYQSIPGKKISEHDAYAYKDFNFYGFEEVDNKLYMMAAWSKYEFEDQHYFVLYPVDQFKKELNEPVSEAFSEKGDPIKDMGIGNLQEFWKKSWQEIGEMHPESTYEKYFPNNTNIDLTGKHKCVYILYDMLGYVSKGAYPKYSFYALFKRACDDNRLVDQDYYKEIKKYTIEVLNNSFGIDVSKTSVNEKFSQEGDPIHDMGIGVDQIVKEFENEMLRDYDLFEPLFAYYPKAKFIRIYTWPLSDQGTKDLIKAVKTILPKYEGVLKATQFPKRTSTSGTHLTDDIIIRII